MAQRNDCITVATAALVCDVSRSGAIAHYGKCAIARLALMRLPYRRLFMNGLVYRSIDRPTRFEMAALARSLCGLTADFLAFDAYDLSGAAAACAETTIAVPERSTIADARVAALVSENAELQQRLAAAETRAHDMQATLQSVSQSQLMRVRQHGTHASVQRTYVIGCCIDRASLFEGLTRL